MRIPVGPGESVELGQLAELVARSILPVRLDDRLAALESQVLVLRERLARLEAPPGLRDPDPGG